MHSLPRDSQHRGRGSAKDKDKDLKDASKQPTRDAALPLDQTSHVLKQLSDQEKLRFIAAKDAEKKIERNVKLEDLKKSATDFKLKTPVPEDLLPILPNDKSKQAEVLRKADDNSGSVPIKDIFRGLKASSQPVDDTPSTTLITDGRKQADIARKVDEAARRERRVRFDKTAKPSIISSAPYEDRDQPYDFYRPASEADIRRLANKDAQRRFERETGIVSGTGARFQIEHSRPPSKHPGDSGPTSEEGSSDGGLQSSRAAWTRTSNTYTTQPTTRDTQGVAGASKGRRTQENDDNDSVRTDGSDDGLDPATSERLSTHFAVELSDQLDGIRFPENVAPLIADHLYDYSCLMRQRAKPGLEHRATVFVRHRRNLIARYFEAKHAAIPDRTENMDSEERVHFLWNREGSKINISDADIDLSNLDANDDIPDEHEFDVTEMPSVRAFLTESTEFAWLLTRIKVDSAMTSTGDTFSSIRRQLCRLVGRKSSLCYWLDWQPAKFLKLQYPHQPDVDLASVICIVGYDANTQATTCAEYVAQVWPSMGSPILECLDLFLQRPNPDNIPLTRHSKGVHNVGTAATDGSPNFTLTTWSDDQGKIRVEVQAESTLLLEAGEVLCWLTVACRESPLSNARGKPAAGYCIPQIVDREFSAQVYEIQCEHIPLLVSTYPDGNCWHRLVRNPTVTKGYPVDTRLNRESGLQIPIEMAATLGFTPRATVFDGSLILKGLCSMFVPVLRVGSSIVWHYIVNADESWMPHTAAKKFCSSIAQVDIADLAGSTHYVGWTRSADFLAGTEHAKYDDIGYGGKFTRRGFALEGVTIGVSSYLSANVKGSPGKKDMRLFQSTGGPYERTIGIASKWNVVFYDTEDDRAWLLDGASALLHLSRAALTHPEAPPVGRGLRPDRALQHVNHRDPEYCKASKVLLDEGNRELTIWEDKTKPWLFEDLVLQHWSILEDMKVHQDKLRSTETKQWELKNPFVTRLEGFGFVDIISGLAPLRPRYATLSHYGTNWLRATTETGAINIIGANLGELIVSSTGCVDPKTLPGGSSLLAAPVQNLRNMARMHGHSFSHEMKLCESVFWNSPHHSFCTDSCVCYSSNNHRDRSPRTPRKAVVTTFDKRATPGRGEERIRDDMTRRFPSAALIIGSRLERDIRGKPVPVDRATLGGRQPSSNRHRLPEATVNVPSDAFRSPTPPTSSGSSTPSQEMPVLVRVRRENRGELEGSSSRQNSHRRVVVAQHALRSSSQAHIWARQPSH